MSRHALIRAGLVLAVVVTVGTGALTVAAAQARRSSVYQAPPPTYSVTVVARTCPDYTDIAANRRRNNLMESLRDLGPDSPYRAGQPVSPAIEDPVHPNCRPLVGWQVQTGVNFNGKKDGLTLVTQPDPASPPTGASVPELDRFGSPTGRAVAGAVTMTLTPAQVDRAARSRLVVQSGTVAEPLLGGTVPGGGAFGVLRCSTDNNNADNAEYLDFPTGDRHVFCYVYLVDETVPEGTIVVRKEIPAGRSDTERFRMGGNVSYQPGGRFDLTVDEGQPAEATFLRAATRAGDAPWEVTEERLPAGWTFTSLACNAPGGSTTTIDGLKATITLLAGDTVTCTYVNSPPPVSGLVVRKVTAGSVGSFPFSVVGPLDGTPATHDFTLETTEDGVEVSANPLTGLTPGRYSITETLPATTPAGSWSLGEVECDGVDMPANGTSIEITLAADAKGDCHFDNVFTPRGRLRISLVTHGGVGTSAFDVTTTDPNTPIHPDRPDETARLTATTDTPGVPVVATGDALDQLAVDPAYLITAQRPATTEAGAWELRSIVCTPTLPAAPGEPVDQFVVFLPAPGYALDCEFAYDLVPPGTLQVIKDATWPPGTRVGPALVDIACNNQAGGQVVLDTDQPGPESLPEAIRTYSPSSCSVVESATGAAPGVAHAVTATVERGGTVVGGDFAQVALEPGTATVIRLSNVYSQASPPPTTPDAPPDSRPPGRRLPRTGPTGLEPLIAAGLGCVVLGFGARQLARARS